MSKKSKCKNCKKAYDFFLHECVKGVQEIYGCKKCDNWCTICNPDWNKNNKKQATMAE